MKVFPESVKWRHLLVLAPLALLIILAIGAAGSVSSGAAEYCYCWPIDPPHSVGISNQLLYVANGRASNVKVIDVGTMSVIDTIPIPNQVAPAILHDMNPNLMNWEVHGVVPSRDRRSIYAVGALSGGSYDQSGNFRFMDYEMYQVDVGTKMPLREIPLQQPGQLNNPVGYCGLEYNRNDENSSEIIATSMNTTNSVLAEIMADPVNGFPIDFGPIRGTGQAEMGGWAFENIATGTNTGFMSTDDNGNYESSTCGISWNADGTRGFAAQLFEPLVDRVNWSTRTTDGQIDASDAPGTIYPGFHHQSTSDKDHGRLYVSSSSGKVDVFDMYTNLKVDSINIRALAGLAYSDIHGVELAPGNDGVLYVTARNAPNSEDNMVLVIQLPNPWANPEHEPIVYTPSLVGAVGGLATGTAGVYAIADKSEYYSVIPTSVSDQLLYVANGRASNVAVIDVGQMKIVDTIPVPKQTTPSGLNELNPGLMNWEIHGVVPSKDRSSIYAVGALSGGSYDGAGNFRTADYEMYQVNIATKETEREIPLQGEGQPYNPVGYCGLEYNLNDESSSEIIAASMNAADVKLGSLLHDPGTGDPIIPGRPSSAQEGGWAFEDISTGANTGFMSTDFNGTLESSTCGISWDASGTRGFAAQMFEPLVTKVNWTTRTVDGEITSSFGPGPGYHQSTSDKAAGRLYVAGSFNPSGIDVFDMNTNLQIGLINISSLIGAPSADIHGVELAPGHPEILYVTARNVPDYGDNAELVIDVSDLNAPVIKGSVFGLARGACGVYAVEDDPAWRIKPGLTLNNIRTYWASYADYDNRRLSVDYSVGNAGPAAANVKIVGSTSTGGVTAASKLPLAVGSIAVGGSGQVTMQYAVPTNIASFTTQTYATAQNGPNLYSYPGPYPGV